MNTNSKIWWIGPLVLILIRVLSLEVALAHAQAKERALVFRTGFGLRLLIGVGVAIFSVQIVKSYGKESGWVIGMGVAIVGLTLLGWPSTLTVDTTAVTQHRWYRRPTRIPWDEVTAILRNKVGDMQVLGKSGRSITFTRYHVDPARFQNEVMRRGRIDTVIDPSAPPSLRI